MTHKKAKLLAMLFGAFGIFFLFAGRFGFLPFTYALYTGILCLVVCGFFAVGTLIFKK